MKTNLMIIERTKRFNRAYKKLARQSQKIINSALILLAENTSHPLLRIKKMKGYQNPDIWEASANMALRINFEMEIPDTIILRNCGQHAQP